MHAHTPPFTKPTGAYDSRKLYDETSAIAAAQDAKSALSDADRYAKLRTAAHYLYHAKLLMDEALDGWRIQSDTHGIPAESAYLVGTGSSKPAPVGVLGYGLAVDGHFHARGDVPIRTPVTDEHGDVVGWTTTPPRHVMHAEAIRDHDERLSGPEPKL